MITIFMRRKEGVGEGCWRIYFQKYNITLWNYFGTLNKKVLKTHINNFIQNVPSFLCFYVSLSLCFPVIHRLRFSVRRPCTFRSHSQWMYFLKSVLRPSEKCQKYEILRGETHSESGKWMVMMMVMIRK